MAEENIMAIYYDFIPTSHQSKKVLWVQTRTQPDTHFRPGTNIRIVSLDKNLVAPVSVFKILDVIGTRVILTPMVEDQTADYRYIIPFIEGNQKLKSKGFIPLNHGGHWAYTLKDWVDTINSNRNWTFGSGKPVAVMISL